MKTCSCGKRYTAAQWRALPSPEGGRAQYYPDESDRWYRLELKNCSCRSTMALEFRAPEEARTEDDARALFGEAA